MKEKSEHIFLFPFTWKYYSKKNSQLFSAHKSINNHFFKNLPSWTNQYGVDHTDKGYNEFIYFYKPVRACLYSFPKEPVVVSNYIYKHLDKSNSLILSVQNKVFDLSINEIRLRLYKTGIGILHISIDNTKYYLPEDIMCINSFSKCIYPPILPINKAKEDLFPDYVIIRPNSDMQSSEYFNENYNEKPTCISKIIMDLLGEGFVCNKDNFKKNTIYIEPVLSNQMFTLCIYKNTKFTLDIKSNKIDTRFLENFIMINKKMVYHTEELKKNKARSIYYIKNDHSVYGMSRMSLICFCNQELESKAYDCLVSLVLMQRATLLSFSNEATRISSLSKEIIIKAIQTIYEIYIQFMNQLYFKEVTEDNQGSIIYERLIGLLNIEEEFTQLGLEIEKMQEYATLLEQSSSKFQVQLISIIGAALILPTFVTGFFGMGVLTDKLSRWWEHKETILWINGYVLLPVFVTISLFSFNYKKTTLNLIVNAVVLTVILISLSIAIHYGVGL
jgi:hypothetical protein